MHSYIVLKDTVTPFQILDEAVYFSYSANTFEKSIYPIIFPSAISK